MTFPPPQDKQRLNATRPERLDASAKRSNKKQEVARVTQFDLPLHPLKPSLWNAFLGALPSSSLTTLTCPRIDAVWDDLTQSVWVKNDAHMHTLWRQGLFGKGFLSRSEPQWRQRVENRRAAAASPQKDADGKEKGGKKTSEEVTADRRRKRIAEKKTKKAERDAEKLVVASAAQSVAGSIPPSPALSASSSTVGGTVPTLMDELDPKLEKIAEEQEREADEEGDEPKKDKKGAEEEDGDNESEDEPEVPPEEWQLTAEHTQLQPEEAYFLLFALPVLALSISAPLSDPPSLSPSTLSSSPRLSILQSLSLFLRSAVPPPPSPSSSLCLDLAPELDPRLNRLDSPFFLNYAAYHHYRSMGWVPRSGVKFCTDWVLYGPGGPVKGHAEFAIVIIPTYSDPSDALSNPFRSTSSYLAVDRDPDARAELAEMGAAGEEGEGREHLLGEGERRNSWRWFHTVNRVCSGVKKTLVFLHVVIPPLSSLPSDPCWVANHPAQALARLEMREVVMRRFIAGRSRD
ncbi:hypothetical protein JCM8547_009239 [Rhodosporidiobolus lusitaniae]